MRRKWGDLEEGGHWQRNEVLKRIFKRSRVRWAVSAGDDPTTNCSELEDCNFFSLVRGGQYFVETSLGSWGVEDSKCFFVIADGTDGDVLPNMLIQFHPSGELAAVIEQTVKRSEEPGFYTPISSHPLYPGGDSNEDFLAHKVADVVIGHLSDRGTELGLGIKPACLR